ncbi:MULTISPECIES: phosphonate ABC transporter ATP-binding protein [Rhodopseudomonas]|uniref:phosphonate ABC transporter ATP-binding protein n=1 Tax=Rhodopseudomonas TaxID=1073 RepID=UPI0005C836D7|nr:MULTISPECIES: phosphonate ABC transporter ATP-binding protein [Rhodopseudomonas]MDF3812997.1 phosphonate ABC transporter ATP-binding protein [Rhodopseudomonas sp. BAL398]WOK15597.1 phosphonate ABC transporter ATP-binding protein [Rhodopseudomonas sp. BAL398]
MTSHAVIDARRISKSFQRGLAVLDDVSVSVARGEMVALIGASGSGKSTLIRAIAGLIPIDGNKHHGGEIDMMGDPIQRAGRLSSNRALRVRIGVIFQQFNLVPRLSLLTNVCFGLLGQLPVLRGTLGRFSDHDKRKAMQALARVGIAEHALRRASELSGGQQQRGAIARTLVQGAELLIADEPIASLDPASARRVMDLIADMNRNDGLTVLISLHQVEYALKYCPRTIALRAGKVVYDGPSTALTPAFLNEIYGAECAELFLPSFEGQAPAAPSAAADALPPPAMMAAVAQAKQPMANYERLSA